MLALARKINESIIINDNVEVALGRSDNRGFIVVPCQNLQREIGSAGSAPAFGRYLLSLFFERGRVCPFLAKVVSEQRERTDTRRVLALSSSRCSLRLRSALTLKWTISNSRLLLNNYPDGCSF